MLLSSILQILDRYQVQPKTAEKTVPEPFTLDLAPAAEKESSRETVDNDFGVTAGFPNPLTRHPEDLFPAQRMEDWIRTVTKFEKPERRVVDVFE